MAEPTLHRTQVIAGDGMRGRVTGVDMIFIGTSNEFGQFESGITAQWFETYRPLSWVELELWWLLRFGGGGSRNFVTPWELHEFTAETESTTAEPA